MRLLSVCAGLLFAAAALAGDGIPLSIPDAAVLDQNGRPVHFKSDLIDGRVVVVNFIALLKLSRESLVEITQAEPFAPIYVRLAYTPA